jgi:hypothetical protein
MVSSQALDDLGDEITIIPIRLDEQAVMHHLNTISRLINSHSPGLRDLGNVIRVSAGDSVRDSLPGLLLMHIDGAHPNRGIPIINSGRLQN